MTRFAKIFVTVILLGSLVVQYDDSQLKFSASWAQDDGTLVINWTPPTEYTNGTVLLEQELDFYTLYCNGVELKQIDSVIGTSTDVVDLRSLSPGDYTCNLSVTALPVTEAVGRESAPSASSVNFTIGDRVPGSPVLTT